MKLAWKPTRLATALRVLGLALAVASLAACVTYRSRGGSAEHGTDKVTVCHKGKKTLVIARPALDAHLRHGDTRGSVPLTGPIHQP